MFQEVYIGSWCVWWCVWLCGGVGVGVGVSTACVVLLGAFVLRPFPFIPNWGTLISPSKRMGLWQVMDVLLCLVRL